MFLEYCPVEKEENKSSSFVKVGYPVNQTEYTSICVLLPLGVSLTVTRTMLRDSRCVFSPKCGSESDKILAWAGLKTNI